MNKNTIRTNRELKKAFQEQIRYCDDYKISIQMLYIEEQLELTVFLDIDDEESADYECVMVEENNEPSNAMLKKANAEFKYFKQHFENVELNLEVINV